MTERLTVHQAFYRAELRHADANRWEAIFEWQVKAQRIEGVHHPFTGWHPTKKFEFDFAHPKSKVAAEIQGGTRGRPVTCHRCHSTVMQTVGGRLIPVCMPLGHGSKTGLRRDYEKLNAAQELGWLLLQFDCDMVQDGSGAELFARLARERS